MKSSKNSIFSFEDPPIDKIRHLFDLSPINEEIEFLKTVFFVFIE